jgi:type VI secretion system protein ImpE
VTVSELFRAGRLKEAIEAQVQEVKNNPADQGRRLFLFELLVFAGEWDRARRQIDAVKYDEMELEMATLNYRKLLDAEQTRLKLTADGPPPKFLSDPPEHARLRLEALHKLRQGAAAEAAALLTQADDAAPAVKGQLNGKPFELLRDCDDLFGPLLEVVAQGNYYWVPLEQVTSLTLREPKTPRDLLWMPARAQLRVGGGGDVFLPALYPNSFSHADDQVKLGRMTDWSEPAGAPVRGLGAKRFLLDDDAVNLVDWRDLQIG